MVFEKKEKTNIPATGCLSRFSCLVSIFAHYFYESDIEQIVNNRKIINTRKSKAYFIERRKLLDVTAKKYNVPVCDKIHIQILQFQILFFENLESTFGRAWFKAPH